MARTRFLRRYHRAHPPPFTAEELDMICRRWPILEIELQDAIRDEDEAALLALDQFIAREAGH